MGAMLVLAAGGVTVAGCYDGAQGAFSGAGLGAAGGAIIGSVFGQAGAGAAIGAVSGALTGAVIGDQNQRQDLRARYRRPVVIENNYYYDEPVYARPYRQRDRYLRNHGG